MDTGRPVPVLTSKRQRCLGRVATTTPVFTSHARLDREKASSDPDLPLSTWIIYHQAAGYLPSNAEYFAYNAEYLAYNAE